jgi:hypothetical protein
MKRKKIFRKRLNLNKRTIVNLNNAEMGNAVGGESLRRCSEVCATFPIKECHSLDPQCPPSNTALCYLSFNCETEQVGCVSRGAGTCYGNTCPETACDC